MTPISQVRTHRLQVRLREISLGDAIYLCSLPADMQEAGTGEFLRRAIEHAGTGRGLIADPSMWTVQERAFCMAHYISELNDGEPDFAIGPAGRLSNYIRSGDDMPPEDSPIGLIAGVHWVVRPLLGVHSEAIERMVASGRLDAGRIGWWFGAMACQLDGDGHAAPDMGMLPDAALEDFIETRVAYFKGLPERDGKALLFNFMAGVERLNHLFIVDFNDQGVVFQATDKEAGLAPASFPFLSALDSGTEEVFGNAQGSGE